MSKKDRICFPRLNVVFSLLVVIPAFFALVALPAHTALACDGGDYTGFRVQAPLDSAPNCSATPPTISVLGQTIDISNATFGEGSQEDTPLACTDLTSGQVVRVTFASDATPLAATFVSSGDRDDQSEVKISGLIQAVDTTNNTVTVLGVTADVSKATLASNDDETPTLSQVAVGQSASLTLTSNTPPLAAATLFFNLVEVKVRAPLDAAPYCTATPPTISVLGLTVDISTATLEGEHGSTFACTDLTAGQAVKVTLASDIPDPTTHNLTATEIELGEGWSDDQSDVKISAPIVSITTDTSTPPNTTVTVLGSLVVDITNAILVADEDQTITLQDLMANQFVTMMLSSNTPPFSATVLAAQTPGNVVNFHVFDEKGQQVDDAGVHDVNAAVTITKSVKKPVTKHITKSVNKAVTLHATSSGSFRVANMPTGTSKVVVTRVNSGKKSNAANLVPVKAKITKSVRVNLKHVR